MTSPRILSSSKYQAALIVTVLGAIPVLYQLGDKGIPRSDKTELLKTFIAGAAATWIAAVGGVSLEDYAEKRDAPSSTKPTPAVQVNTSPGNVQQTGSPAPVLEHAEPAKPPVSMEQVVGAINTLARQMKAVQQAQEAVAAEKEPSA